MSRGTARLVLLHGISALVLFTAACGGDGDGAADGSSGSGGFGAGETPGAGGPTTPAPPERTGTGPKLDCGGGACVVTSMAMGMLSACVLLQDETVACYGSGVVGTLGRGEEVATDPFPQRVKGLSGVSSVFGGAYNYCAITKAGELFCWGADQSANPFSRKPGALAPAKIDGLANVVQAATSLSHTCALTSSGDVYCWGSNYLGELGDGTFDNHAAPVKVKDLGDVAQITVGNEHSCARKKNGQVLCWGGNAKGQLGTSDEGHQLPQPVPGVAKAVDLSASAAAETVCATLEDRTVTCWGEKWKGAVAGVKDVRELRVGWNVACALLGSGQVSCWGDNNKGQLGIGTMGDGKTGPTAVKDVQGAKTLAVAGDSACSVFAEGWLACWGDDTSGQLGDGATKAKRPTPVKVRH